MEKKINIIQFLPYFPPHKGGLETVAEELSTWRVKKGYGDLYNITFDVGQESAINDETLPKIKDEKGNIIGYKKNGYEVLCLPSFEVVYNFPFPRFWDKKFGQIIKYIKKIETDIIQTHTRFFLSSFIGGVYAKLRRKKRVHIEHGSNYVKLGSKLKSLVAKAYDWTLGLWTLRNANIVLPISEACKKFSSKFTGKKMEVLYRGIELEEKNVKKSGDIRLVFIGRLVNLKGVHDLIRAYENLDNKIQLDIIGDGDEKISLKEYVKINNLTNVNFLGFKNKEFIVDYLSKNNCILINPSYQEGLPTTVLEGLFYKNVVIATDVGGTSEISREKDLILIKSGDVDGLKGSIEKAIIEYKDLVGLSKRTISEKFDWNKNIEKLYFLVK